VRVRSMKLDVYPDAAVGCEIVRARWTASPANCQPARARLHGAQPSRCDL